MDSSRTKAITAGVVALAVAFGGLQMPPAAAADPKKPKPVSAEDSVVSVSSKTVPKQLDSSKAGTARPQAARSKVVWPTARTTNVKLTGSSRSRSAGAVALRPMSGGPEQVTVATYDHKTAEKLGGHGVALKLTRTDGSRRSAPVGVTVDVGGFATAYG